jgi:hypothetical protein
MKYCKLRIAWSMVWIIGFALIPPSLQPNSHGSATLRWLSRHPWQLAVLVGLIAAVPWLRCRFSLRALLIFATLAVVLFGLIVWLRLR